MRAETVTLTERNSIDALMENLLDVRPIILPTKGGDGTTTPEEFLVY